MNIDQKPGWFPITIRITSTQEEYQVEKPEDLPSGVGFTVIRTSIPGEVKQSKFSF